MPENNPATPEAPSPAPAAPTPAAPAPAPAGGAPAPAQAPGAPADKPRPIPMAIRRSDSSRCRTPGCTKYHDFFQWNGKYYCLECYEALRSATRVTAAT